MGHVLLINENENIEDSEVAWLKSKQGQKLLSDGRLQHDEQFEAKQTEQRTFISDHWITIDLTRATIMRLHDLHFTPSCRERSADWMVAVEMSEKSTVKLCTRVACNANVLASASHNKQAAAKTHARHNLSYVE